MVTASAPTWAIRSSRVLGVRTDSTLAARGRRLVNPLLRALVLRAGLGRRGRGGQDVLRVLRVRGRRSGRAYDVPVRIATWKGRRYLLSLLGEAQWVRNLRAAGAAQLLLGSRAEPVVAREIGAEDKAAFLVWYYQHPAYRLRARYGLRADTANLTPAEVDRLARRYPVFRLDPAGTPGQGEHADASRSASP